MEKRPCVYITASQKNGTLYVGVTSDLVKRIHEHKEGIFEDSFTDVYGVDRLVWFEFYQDMNTAFLWEKKIKRWNRLWKIGLIEKSNPGWIDVCPQLTGRM